MIERNGGPQARQSVRLRAGLGAVLGTLLVVGTVYAGTPASERARHAGGKSSPVASGVQTEAHLAVLESRVDRVNRGWARLAAYYDSQVEPIERVLRHYSNDDVLVGQIAAALVREAKAADLEPRLLLGVLLVENPWLDPKIRSSVGAVGLMQIMPVHQGGWSCGYDLEDINTNICLGAQVFAHYFERTGGDMQRALLRYNGCVTGSNTPNCHQYPSQVFARAGRVSLAQGPAAASP